MNIEEQCAVLVSGGWSTTIYITPAAGLVIDKYLPQQEVEIVLWNPKQKRRITTIGTGQ